MNDRNVEALAQRATELADHVGKLRLAIDSLDRRTDRSEKVLTITVVGLVLDILLSVAVMWGYHIQQVQADQLADTVVQQQKTRDQAICPMFSVFLGSYDPTTRPPTGRQTYENVYNQMRVIYQNIGCTTPIVPPRIP